MIAVSYKTKALTSEVFQEIGLQEKVEHTGKYYNFASGYSVMFSNAPYDSMCHSIVCYKCIICYHNEYGLNT